MTSFEFFKLLKFKKKLHFTYIFLYFFLLKYYLCDKLHHFMKKIQCLLSNYGIITGFKIKLCKNCCRKEKWAGLKILICINLNVYNYSLGLNILMGFSAIFFSHKYMLIRSISGKSKKKTVQ